MNKGLARLGVIARKQEQEQAFAAWVNQDPQRKAKYGEVLDLLKKDIHLPMNTSVLWYICWNHSKEVQKLSVWHVW